MLHAPQVQKVAQEELARVIGNDRLPTFSDRDSLPYINCIVKETYRWEQGMHLYGVPASRPAYSNHSSHSPRGASSANERRCEFIHFRESCILTWIIRSIKVTLSLRVSLLVPSRLPEEVTECILLGTTMIVSAWFSLSSPAAAGTICIIRSMGHREYTTCTDAPYYQLTPFL